MWAFTVIPPVWRERGDEIVFIVSVLVAFAAAVAIIARMFKVGRRIGAAAGRVVQRTVQPMMDRADRFLEAKINELEDRVELLEVTSGGRHASEIAAMLARLDVARAVARHPASDDADPGG